MFCSAHSWGVLPCHFVYFFFVIFSAANVSYGTEKNVRSKMDTASAIEINLLQFATAEREYPELTMECPRVGAPKLTEFKVIIVQQMSIRVKSKSLSSKRCCFQLFSPHSAFFSLFGFVSFFLYLKNGSYSSP